MIATAALNSTHYLPQIIERDREGSPMHRLFIAIRLPDAVCDLLLDTMEGLDGARWQDADSLHITLRFVGEVDRRTAEDLAAELERIAAAPFPLEICGVGHFEKSNRHGARPHAIWAGIADSAPLETLRRQVERACVIVGLGREERRYAPHITLARLNAASGPVAGWLAAHGTLHCGPWIADGISLYESHLTSHGSEYAEVVRYPLG